MHRLLCRYVTSTCFGLRVTKVYIFSTLSAVLSNYHAQSSMMTFVKRLSLNSRYIK